MKVGVSDLKSRAQSGKSIYRMANYYRDLGKNLDTTLSQFFDFVRNIPFEEDPLLAEITSRPLYLLDRVKFPALDCKKKAVLMGAWFNAHNIPWRLVAVSEKPDKQPHHVFTQAKIEGEWRAIDPTYPHYMLFEPKKMVTYAEELPR